MIEHKSREDAIDELTMALLYLLRFPDSRGSAFDEISWKGYDFNALERLDQKEWIVDPVQRHSHSRYVYLTEEGRKAARKLLAEYGIADTELYERFEFRTIRPEEAAQAAEIEAACFPPNEACSREMMLQRVELASDLFLVAVDRETGKLAGFLNGLATNETSFRDEFFTDAHLHDPEGRNIMLCGLDVLPAYRKQGLARELIYNYCRREQERNRQRLILTCLKSKVKMYKKMGFQDRGEANSSWGGEKWHEMACLLNLGWSPDKEL